MRQVLGRDTHGHVVARLQVVAEFTQRAAIARHQHQAIAVAREQVRQFQSDAAGRAGDQDRLGSEKRIACTHNSVIADFAVIAAVARTTNPDDHEITWRHDIRFENSVSARGNDLRFTWPRLHVALRLQEGHDLPALLFRQVRPRGHARFQLSFGDEPEYLSRFCVFSWGRVECRRRSHSLQIAAVTLRAILHIQLLARQPRLRRLCRDFSSPRPTEAHCGSRNSGQRTKAPAKALRRRS